MQKAYYEVYYLNVLSGNFEYKEAVRSVVSFENLALI